MVKALLHILHVIPQSVTVRGMAMIQFDKMIFINTEQ